MEFVGIEKQLFEELVRKFEYFEHRVMEICNRENDRTLHKWMDNQDVCRYLNISPRTLQTLRDNGTLPFSQILFLKSITRYSTSRKMYRVSSRKLRTEEKRHFTEAVIYSRKNNH